MFKSNQQKYFKLCQIIFQFTFVHIASINRNICIFNFFQVQTNAYSKKLQTHLKNEKKRRIERQCCHFNLMEKMYELKICHLMIKGNKRCPLGLFLFKVDVG